MRALVAAALFAAGCGASAVCGNGKVEDGEQCDDGNLVDGDGCSPTCRAQATIDTFIHFLPIKIHEYPDFEGETCGGLGLKEVDVTVTGPKTVSSRVACSFGQVKLSSLPAGDYVAVATGFDSGGAAITRGLARAEFTHADAQQDVNLDFPFADFVNDYRGTFFFRTQWGGASTCAGAMPPVAQERLVLEHDGAPLSQTTSDGVPLDGTAAGACQDANGMFSQSAKDLPWGPATLTVTGEDEGGMALYSGSFDTFVGAGAANPVVTVDVPSLSPDAGVADGSP